jgi:hypothetical protein
MSFLTTKRPSAVVANCFLNAAGKRKNVDPHGRLWQSVLEATGQNTFING